METTNKINIFIADDEPNELKKIKDILNNESSILKGHFKVSQAYFVNTIPEGNEIYNERHIATHVIDTTPQIDIAMVDLVFIDEFESTSLEGAEIIIRKLHRKFPYCPVGILSNNAGGIFLNTNIKIDDTFYPCMAKKPNLIDIDTYNHFFLGLLKKWLRIKLSQIDRENKVDELLGLLANPQKTLESTFSFGNETWILADLFCAISKNKKKPIRDFIVDYLVTMPRLRQLKNPKKTLAFYDNTTNEWSIPFSELFNSYYSFFSFQAQNSFKALAANSEIICKKLHATLCVSNMAETNLSAVSALIKKMSTTSIRNQFLNDKGVMPHAVVPLFKEKLTQRMIALNLYCFFGFSGTGINYVLNKNNDALHNNHTKGISKFLGISLPDQYSTKVDMLVCDFEEADRRRREIKPSLSHLDSFQRQYDFQLKFCGSYEKKHLKSMLLILTQATCDNPECTICKTTKKNIQFIKDNSLLGSNN